MRSRVPALALAACATAVLAGCNGEVYLRDGVTDGDTFYLAERALHDPDPVLQSWVSYSLTRSTCQLTIGGDNPARATSFDCELAAREHLVETWREDRDPSGDRYLDALGRVADAGLLPDYVWHYFRRSGWRAPPGLDPERFGRWRREHLAGHEPETRWVGAWGYAHRHGRRDHRERRQSEAETGANSRW